MGETLEQKGDIDLIKNYLDLVLIPSSFIRIPREYMSSEFLDNDRLGKYTFYSLMVLGELFRLGLYFEAGAELYKNLI